MGEWGEGAGRTFGHAGRRAEETGALAGGRTSSERRGEARRGWRVQRLEELDRETGREGDAERRQGAPSPSVLCAATPAARTSTAPATPPRARRARQRSPLRGVACHSPRRLQPCLSRPLRRFLRRPPKRSHQAFFDPGYAVSSAGHSSGPQGRCAQQQAWPVDCAAAAGGLIARTRRARCAPLALARRPRSSVEDSEPTHSHRALAISGRVCFLRRTCSMQQSERAPRPSVRSTSAVAREHSC